ncbi:MAG: hypothetical protein ACOC3V_03675, partial [bacterium]
MFKIYGKGDTVSSGEFWDGRTKYNSLQRLINRDYRKFKDLLKPLKENFETTTEIFDFFEKFVTMQVSKNGVLENSFNNELNLDANDVVTISIGGEQKTYLRIPPGSAAYDGTFIINKPAIDLAAKEIEEILELDTLNEEKVEIKYNYEDHTFKGRIYIKEREGAPLTIFEYANNLSWDDSDSGYETGIALLFAMYSDSNFNEKFIKKVGYDLTKINLEETINITDLANDWYYLTINLSGNFELVTTFNSETHFQLSYFQYVDGALLNIDNTHTLFSVFDNEGAATYNFTDGFSFTDDSGGSFSMDASGNVTLQTPGGTGTFTINADLIINGNTTTIDTTTLQVEDNLIVLNKNLSGSGPPSGFISGIEVNRGTSPTYLFVFDEDTGTFRIGEGTEADTSGLQSVATRENEVNNALAFWNENDYTLNFSSNLIWNNGLHVSGENNFSVNTNVLFVDATNNRIGINTNTPSYILDVNPSSGSGRMYFTVTNNSHSALYLENDDIYIIGYNSAHPTESNNLAIKNNTVGGDIFFTNESGETLRILNNGNVNFLNDINVTGNLTVQGVVSSGLTINSGLVIGSGDIILPNLGSIHAGTSDGSDTHVLHFAGGGNYDTSRGGSVRVYGNEHTTRPGNVDIYAGNISGGGNIQLFTGSAVVGFVLDANRNVGIGRTTPLDGHRLAVTGSLGTTAISDVGNNLV